ncbi:MAG TPA: hypothetical protein VHS03_16290 [Gaiellaceae bacterium]|nr:hypothetical protein [Gaiellaceae bacterium]
MTVAVLSTALLALTTGRAVADGGQPPCPSCPDRVPPPGGGSGPGSGAGGSGGPTAAPSRPVQPLVSLGGVSVTNGVAAVTGVVNTATNAAGAIAARVHVTIDANPIDVAANGQFSAKVDVGAKAKIVVRASNGSGQSSTISIPTSAVPSDGTPADALAQLNADAIVLLQPPDGFTSIDGLSVDAGVHVKAVVGIAGLDLNGVNVLAKLRVGSSSKSKPSSSGSGSSPAPPSQTNPGTTAPPPTAPKPPIKHSTSTSVSGHSKTVALTVTGTNGVSQTTTVRVKQISSVIRVGRMLSISAFGARGIRITGVRFDTSHVVGLHRLGVTVTVRDRRNYLVRDATVMLVPTAHRSSLRGSLAAMSGMLGTARFKVPVASTAMGHRMYLTVVARTPRASARVTRSVALCGCMG